MVKKKTEGSLWIYITMPVKEKKKKTNKQTYQVVAVKRWWKHKLLLRHWQRYDKVTCHGGSGSIVPLHSLVVKLSFLFFPSASNHSN